MDKVPLFFKWLTERNRIRMDQILFARDGFCMVMESLSAMLISEGIEALPDRDGKNMECRYFFDDWFLYAVPDGDSHIYGLLKMREQEHEREKGIHADGDTPGVTVSFIAFDTDILKNCLENPTAAGRKDLGVEINRVVAYPKQSHHPALKAYFIRPQAEAAYLIADAYIRLLASFCWAGVLRVPEACRDICRKRNRSARYARIPDFLDQNNRGAGETVCDCDNIFIRDPDNLSEFEKLAILATHTGNVSLHSFAAEVRYHAMFLTELAKITLPLVSSPYASAVRADMSIADKEFQGPTPYYDLSGRLVREQTAHHPHTR